MPYPRLACAMTAALALLPACKQSLFDDSTANDKADAGGVGPDGAIAGCPAPCLGDAVAEWTGAQGGTMGRFHYRDYGRDPGHDAADMSAGDFMGSPSFLGRGTPKDAITVCTGALAGTATCAGLEGALLLVPGQASTGGADPVVEYVSSVNGTLRVSGTLATATGATGGRQHLRLVRNARADDLLDVTYRPGDPVATFDTQVDVRAGDRIGLLAAAPLDGAATPLGVQFYVNEVTGEDHCQLAVDFEEGPHDRCSDTDLMRLSSETPAVLSTPTGSLAPDFGSAEHIASGSYLKAGAVADYSHDFTVQFWMKVQEPPEFQSCVYADWSCDAQGGLNIAPTEGQLALSAFWKDASADYCNTTAAPIDDILVDRPADGGWHFVRVSRSTVDEKLRLCIDGKKLAEVNVPAEKDMTSAEAPHIGRNVVYNPAYFVGDVDDIRVLTRALPCD